MQDVKLAIGKKIFTFKCDDRDLDKIYALSKELNLIINRNMLKYRGISEDNVFLLTVFELLDSLKSGKNTSILSQVIEVIKDVTPIKNLPELHHPYPQVLNNNTPSLSNIIFNKYISAEEKIVDILIQKQQDINQEITLIMNSINSIAIALNNGENNDI